MLNTLVIAHKVSVHRSPNAITTESQVMDFSEIDLEIFIYILMDFSEKLIING